MLSLLLLLFLFPLSYSSPCSDSTTLTFSSPTSRYSFIYKPLPPHALDDPGCGNPNTRVTSWYKLQNTQSIPQPIQITTTTTSTAKLHTLHSTHLSIINSCQTTTCIASNVSRVATTLLNFTLPPSSIVYFSFYQTLNTVPVSPHLFIRIGPHQLSTICDKAKDVLIPFTAISYPNTYYRLPHLSPYKQYIVDSCGYPHSSLQIYRSCEEPLVLYNEAIMRSCLTGGTQLLINPTEYIKDLIVFVNTTKRTTVHFSKIADTEQTLLACQKAKHIPFIPYTISSLSFSSQNVVMGKCNIKGEKHTAFFEVTVHKNHYIILETCDSHSNSIVSFWSSCTGSCLNVSTTSCHKGAIYTYTPTSSDAHTIIIAVAEEILNSFGRVKLVFKEKEIGKDVDDELHIAVDQQTTKNRKKPRLQTFEINTHQSNFFLKIMLGVVGVIVILIIGYFISQRSGNTSGEYIPL
ncbi:CUB domain-containing protein [Entamoeba marina]